MKKNYETPEIDVVMFITEDIIATSGTSMEDVLQEGYGDNDWSKFH